MLSLGVVLLLPGLLMFFNIQASIKVKQGNGSGRTLSRIMAILMLLTQFAASLGRDCIMEIQRTTMAELIRLMYQGARS